MFATSPVRQQDRRAASRPGTPPVWAAAPPRFMVLAAGFVVAAVATPFSRQQVAVSIVGVLWVALTVVVAHRAPNDQDRNRWSGWARGSSVAVIDAVLVIVAIAVSGGAHSPLRWLLIGAPASWAAARDPHVGRLGALGAAGYLLASVDDLARGRPETVARIVGFFAIYGGAVLIARQAVRARQREVALQATVDREREESDRRLLAQARAQQEDLVLRLHDGPLQLVSVAHQDLEELCDGEEIDLAQTKQLLKDAIVGMRTLTGELYAAVLADAGLAGALRQIAGSIQQRGGPPTSVSVGVRTAGLHDELVLRTVRELLSNVQKHARATGANVSVVLQGHPEELIIVVSDNGIGIDGQDRRDAEREGHIGLTSIGKHVAEVNGTFQIEHDSEGTTVRVRLPLPEPGHSTGA